MKNEIQKVQENIDLMLAQQVGELRYFRDVKSKTAKKTTDLYYLTYVSPVICV